MSAGPSSQEFGLSGLQGLCSLYNWLARKKVAKAEGNREEKEKDEKEQVAILKTEPH